MLFCRGHSNVISDSCFSNDERILATASWDKNIQLWDVSSGTYRYCSVMFYANGMQSLLVMHSACIVCVNLLKDVQKFLNAQSYTLCRNLFNYYVNSSN